MKNAQTPDFQFIAGNLALDFVNTVGNRLGSRDEYFCGREEFDRWAHLAGLLAPKRHLSLTRRELVRVRAIRETLHAILRPIALGSSPSTQSLASLNPLLVDVSTKRELRWTKGAFTWEWRTLGRDPDAVLAPVLMSMAELFVSKQFGRIRECDGTHCGWLFLDRSAAGGRRWCSMADCGNRAKARAFARRQ